MFNYLVRRTLTGLLTLWLVTFLIMAIIRNMPGDPAALQAMGSGESAQDSTATEELIKEMRASYGLDRPWYEGYATWMRNLFHGDLGRSLYDKKPVTERIGERAGATLILSLLSILITYGLTIPFGLYMTAKNGKWQEQVLSSGFYVLYSIPNYVAGLYLILLFAVRLDVLPLRGVTSDPEVYAALPLWGKALDVLKHVAMPLFCYTFVGLAFYARFVRATMLEVVRQDFIRTARAKGVSEPVVFYRHAFRNALIPLCTLIGLALPGLLAGSVLIEKIFNWPGMGRLFLEAITQRDYPVIMGLVLTFAVLVQAGSLLSDVLYAVVDPRITYS